MEMRNISTGETSPAHFLGWAEDGRELYQFVEGWELVTSGGESDCVGQNVDGNYLVGVAKPPAYR